MSRPFVMGSYEFLPVFVGSLEFVLVLWLWIPHNVVVAQMLWREKSDSCILTIRKSLTFVSHALNKCLAFTILHLENYMDACGYIPDFFITLNMLSHQDYYKQLFLTCNSPPRPVNRLYRKLCACKFCISL